MWSGAGAGVGVGAGAGAGAGVGVGAGAGVRKDGNVVSSLGKIRQQRGGRVRVIDGRYFWSQRYRVGVRSIHDLIRVLDNRCTGDGAGVRLICIGHKLLNEIRDRFQDLEL